MSYEIPKDIKYQEKILFNLSFEQALWVGLFGFIIFALFFKTNIAFEIKTTLSITIALAGIGFAFLNLQTKITHLISFLKKPRKMGYLDNSMKKFFGIKKIEKDSVYFQNGSVKAIVHVQPINFNILSTNQRKAIIASYKEFLHSLDFPIQIVMRTVNLDLEDYLQKLHEKAKKSKKPSIMNQFQDFKEFVQQYISENNVKNRLFYIVIPVEKSRTLFEKQHNPLHQLEIRTKLCQEKLRNCNLTTKRLKTNELVSLFASYSDGFIETGTNYESYLTIQKSLEKKTNHAPS
jgi:hypothetical protein